MTLKQMFLDLADGNLSSEELIPAVETAHQQGEIDQEQKERLIEMALLVEQVAKTLSIGRGLVEDFGDGSPVTQQRVREVMKDLDRISRRWRRFIKRF